MRGTNGRSSWRLLAPALAALGGLLAAPRAARADGFIIVEEPPPTIVAPGPARHFPLRVREHRVTVEVAGAVARTHVDQVFENPHPVQLEGTYVFPLPEGAAVSGFSLFVDGREVAGEMLDRDRARQIYEGIVRRMEDPALLEYVGRGMFRARVFPIPARGERRVTISYDEVVSQGAGLCEYRYPLNTERFSAGDIDTVSVGVTIQAPGPIRAVYSPTHDVSVSRPDARRATAFHEARRVRPDRDFVLYYTVSEDDVALSTVSYQEAGEDGYFLVVAAPRTETSEADIQPKDIVFVLDTSGSMNEGGKMEQARRALRYCLDAIHPADRFAIVDFSTSVRAFRDALVPAGAREREAAHAYVTALAARGGTDIHGALSRALAYRDASPAAAARPFVVCFLTDGLPTIGITDPEQIRQAIVSQRSGRERLFCFGVGHDVNTHLLDRLAEEMRGDREYVLPGEDIEVKVSRFYDKVAYPVLTDVAIEIDGVWTQDLFPKPLPDLFRGGQVVLAGRFRGEGQHAVRLRGMVNGRPREFVTEASFTGDPKADFIPRIWAHRKIGYLLDQVRLNGENPELIQEIVALAQRHGIVTPYTSYLVLEDDRDLSMNRPDAQHALGQPRAPASRGATGEEDRGGGDRFEYALRRQLQGGQGGQGGPAGSGATAPAQPGPADPSRPSAGAGGESQPVPGFAAPEPQAPPPPPAVAPRSGDDAAREAFRQNLERAGRRGDLEEAEQQLRGYDEAYGRNSVELSALVRRMRQAENESAAPDAAGRLRIERDLCRNVGSRAFYNVGGTWVDSTAQEGLEEVEVEYLSDAYFALIREHPELQRYFALGDRVIARDGQRVYRVTRRG